MYLANSVDKSDHLADVFRTLPRTKNTVALGATIIDIATLELCLFLAYLLRLKLLAWYPIPLDASTFVGISAGVLIVPFAYYHFGLYPGYGLTEVERIRRRVVATVIVFVSLVAWDYLAQNGLWSRGILLAAAVFATVLGPLASAYYRQVLMRLGFWGAPVAIIGAGETGRAVVRDMKENPALGMIPVCYLDYDPELIGEVHEGIPVVGTLSLASELARRIKIAAIAVPEFEGSQLSELSARLPFPHIIIMPDLAGIPCSWVTPREFGGNLGLEVKKNLLLRHNQIIKRAIDYVLSIPLFIASLALLLIFLAIVAAVSRANPIFIQERKGIGGKKFDMIKIRTMYRDAEERLEQHLAGDDSARVEWLNRFKLANDPRILPIVGNFLRRSSLDELPQLWNVLRGDMSLVGPRPFPAYHLDMFDDDFRALRESVRPGLTGMWQVEVRADSNLARQEFYDTYYIRNWSLWLDVYILFRTITAVTSGKGAH